MSVKFQHGPPKTPTEVFAHTIMVATEEARNNEGFQLIVIAAQLDGAGKKLDATLASNVPQGDLAKMLLGCVSQCPGGTEAIIKLIETMAEAVEKKIKENEDKGQ